MVVLNDVAQRRAASTHINITNTTTNPVVAVAQGDSICRSWMSAASGFSRVPFSLNGAVKNGFDVLFSPEMETDRPLGAFHIVATDVNVPRVITVVKNSNAPRIRGLDLPQIGVWGR